MSNRIIPLLVTMLAGLAACGSQPISPNPHDGAPPPEGSGGDAQKPAAGGVYDLTVTSLDGAEIDLGAYRGKVTLVVNVASQCGYTPQYAGLQQLHDEFADRGFAVLGFPSNEFGGQEPGSAEEIRAFCSENYSVDFPMFAKCAVKAGDGQSPVYAALSSATGEEPSWNFCKYLVGRDGRAIAFFPSRTAPDAPDLRKAIEAALD